jgi:hypothetical protein
MIAFLTKTNYTIFQLYGLYNNQDKITKDKGINIPNSVDMLMKATGQKTW